MSREMWKAVKTKAGETMVVKIKEEKENNRSKKGNRRIKDLR